MTWTKILAFFDVETIGVIFGFLCVYLTVKENNWCWPTGIMNVIYFFILFVNARLYGQAFLQVFFLVLSIYGWYQWLHGGLKKSKLHISRLQPKEFVLHGFLTIAFTLGAGFGLHYFAHQEVSYLDAAITGLSFIAQYLLAKKKLENWLGWIVVNVLSVILFSYKGLYKTAFLYVVFLILATQGFVRWKKNYLLQTTPEPPPVPA